MDIQKKSFLLYFDSYPMLIGLSPEQRGWVLSALFDFAGQVWRNPELPAEDTADLYPQLTESGRMVFGFLASIVRRDTLRWLSQREARAQRRQQARTESAPASKPKEPTLEQYQMERERTKRLLEEWRGVK